MKSRSMTKAMILLLPLVNLISPQALSCEKTKLLDFAHQLMTSGEYYRAITEFYRFNSYFPEDSVVVDNLYRIAECYALADHLLEAVEAYEGIRRRTPGENHQCVVNIAVLYNRLHYFYESNRLIDQHHQETESRFDSLLILRGINSVYLGNYQEASRDFESVNKEGALWGKARLFNALLEENVPLQSKSTAKGAIFGALLPGAGYLYAEKPQTAVAALAVNVLFGYAAYRSFRNDQPGMGVVLGVFAASFYFGSLYGTIQAVDFYNQRIKLQFSQQFTL